MNDLFIGGGGYDGVMFIGVLEYLHENKLLDVKNFYGTSIGSLIGILYISGNTPKDILKKVINLDFSKTFRYNITNLFNYHIIDDTVLDCFLEKAFDSINKTITIGEFSENFNVNINIHATKITTGEYINFNTKDYPNVNLRDVVKASMSIPLLFKPVKINGYDYVDGCCKNLTGSPKDDIYIYGYSIICKTVLNDNSNVILKIIKSIVSDKLPNSKFIIKCIVDGTDTSTYVGLDKINENGTLDLYKRGLHIAKKYFSLINVNNSI